MLSYDQISLSSATFQTLATVCGDGVQPLVFSPPNGEQPQEAKAAAWMAIVGVRWEDAAWNRSARQLATRRVRLLLFVCPVQARTSVLLLLLHAFRELQSSAPPPVITLHHAGGDLHPSPVRCTSVCGRRCFYFGSSMCCAFSGGALPRSVATTSST
jgi:hypothetical protein